jgi:predicted transposase YdaD
MRRNSIYYRFFQQLPTLLFDLIPNPPENAEAYIFEAIEIKEAKQYQLLFHLPLLNSLSWITCVNCHWF